jgi:flagellar biosynthesis protein FlhF
MKIKRYTAVSMRAALAQVRAEQGPEAVILSSRRIDDGIEVIAAVDYDEALFLDVNRQRMPAPAENPQAQAPDSQASTSNPVSTANRVSTLGQMPASNMAPPSNPSSTLDQAPTQVSASSRPRAPLAPAAAAARQAEPAVAGGRSKSAAARRPEGGYGEMQRELRDMRQLLESGLADMTWNTTRLREPLKARVLEELSALDIAPDVAMALAALTPRRTSLENPSHIPLALLVKHLPVVNDLSGLNGGTIAVVGPTGVGKTTTIAKLAARWSMQHGSRDLALVSTDSYRIGARDQLMTYARILGAPLHVANTGRELLRVLERLKTKKLVLIDTAGMGPRDVRLAEQLAALQLGASRARVLLALPAQGEGHSLDELIRAFARVSPVASILTKVDEAASLGAAISTALRHKLPIAYLCNGQRVPEDLHAAHQKRVWLVRSALKLKSCAPARRDEAYLARNFGRAAAHA